MPKKKETLMNFRLDGELGVRVLKEKNTDDVCVTFYDIKKDITYHGNIGMFGQFSTEELTKWIPEIVTRILDNAKMDLDEDDMALLESVLLKTSWAYPNEIMRLIGTGVIEESYFEEEDNAKDPF